MSTLTVVPVRAQFRPGEPVGVAITATGEPRANVRVSVTVSAGAPTVATSQHATVACDIALDDQGHGRCVEHVDLGQLDLPPRGSTGFSVRATSADAVATTSFDVAEHWSHAPRYGFFADFGPEETLEDTSRRADDMLALHLNVVQFYDWMYSHHTLVPPTDEFVDPLGRLLSMDIVRRKVDAAHERGMAAIGYGALYGAEAEFANEHADLLLYDGGRRAIQLADIFYLQDIRNVSAWRRWILDQFRDAVERVGFDGIHIDQYGYPKRSLSRAAGHWEEVDLGAEFMGFVQQACAELAEAAPHGGSIFNLVNAWPLDRLGELSADAATYIEVWDPHSTYRDLYELITAARRLRPDKRVILSAYLRAFHPGDGRRPGAMNAFRLAQAAIGASGGFHLIAGEGSALLTEAYYPSYGRLSASEADVVRRYADFAVRNTAALHAHAPDVAWTQVGATNDVVLLEHEALAGPQMGLIDTGERYGAGARLNSVWCVQRDQGAVSSLSLVNLLGLATDHWNSAQPDAPTPLHDITVRAVVTGDVTGVWWDTPDDTLGVARELPYTVTDDGSRHYVEFTIP